jgi:hypothetical protein
MCWLSARFDGLRPVRIWQMPACGANMRRLISAIAFVIAGSIHAFGSTLPLLPNLMLTPGVVRGDLTLRKICRTKWGRDARHVSKAMKQQVFTAYGLSGNIDPACIRDASGRHCEIDHLISRELGGADDVRNLWPQSYGSMPWNAVRKDCIETRLHKEVCAKHATITLKQAQDDIRLNWTAVYLRYYEFPVPGKKCTLKKH